MFSIFNLINTLISRISTRRKEFGISESIGMTKKQIKKMLLQFAL
ncbi:FtsX-like permease family protein [Lachnospiraceae bacterium 54-11]